MKAMQMMSEVDKEDPPERTGKVLIQHIVQVETWFVWEVPHVHFRLD